MPHPCFSGTFVTFPELAFVVAPSAAAAAAAAAAAHLFLNDSRVKLWHSCVCTEVLLSQLRSSGAAANRCA